jgi:hypothetical protein
MAILDSMKLHPWKVLLGSSGTIITLVGALFTLDARYAHAADVEKDTKRTEQIIIETSRSIRQQNLEDKLFELDIKREQSPTQRLSPVDAALHSRFKRQLDELQQQRKN